MRTSLIFPLILLLNLTFYGQTDKNIQAAKEKKGKVIQEKFVEILVSDLKGEDKCMYDRFIRTMKSNILSPESTKFYYKVSIYRNKNIYKIQSFAKGKNEVQVNQIIDMIMNYQLDYEILISSPDCNKQKVKLLKMSIDQAYAKPPDTDFFIKDQYQYDIVKYSHILFVLVSKNKKWGVVDKNSRIIIPIEYDSLIFHPLGLEAKLKNKWFFLDIVLGTMKSQNKYDEISLLYKVNDRKYVIVKSNNKYALLDSNLNEITPFVYDNILSPFGKVFSAHGNLCFIGTRENKQVLINEMNGKERTPLKYSSIFTNYSLQGILFVSEDNKFGIIDSLGMEIIQPEYDKIYQCVSKGILGLKINGKYAIYDYIKNEKLTDHIYDDIFNVRYLIGVEVIGKKGVINKDGKIIVPIAYDKINYNEFLNSDKLRIFGINKEWTSEFDENGKCVSNCK